MKYIISLIIFIAVFLAAGHFLLRLFSQVSGVDMQGAFKWSFSAKRFEIFIPVIFSGIMTFVFVFGAVTTPFVGLTVNTTQRSGLSGYPDDDNIYYYFNPVNTSYEKIEYAGTIPPYERFDHTFSVISFYKPLFMKQYQDLASYGFVRTIVGLLIFFLIGPLPLYFLLRYLANEFSKANGISEKIAHSLLKTNFTALLGKNGLIILGLVIIILILMTMVNAFYAHNIRKNNRSVLENNSNNYRQMIMQKISPGSKVTGRVIRREYDPIIITSSDDIDDFKRLRKKYEKTMHTPAYNYTIEFSRILDFPIYLKMRLVGGDEPNQKIDYLNSLFSNQKVKHTMYYTYPVETHPETLKDLNFKVEANYSVSLIIDH